MGEKDPLFKYREPQNPFPIPRHIPIEPMYGSNPHPLPPRGVRPPCFPRTIKCHCVYVSVCVLNIELALGALKEAHPPVKFSVLVAVALYCNRFFQVLVKKYQKKKVDIAPAR